MSKLETLLVNVEISRTKWLIVVLNSIVCILCRERERTSWLEERETMMDRAQANCFWMWGRMASWDTGRQSWVSVDFHTADEPCIKHVVPLPTLNGNARGSSALGPWLPEMACICNSYT